MIIDPNSFAPITEQLTDVSKNLDQIEMILAYLFWALVFVLLFKDYVTTVNCKENKP